MFDNTIFRVERAFRKLKRPKYQAQIFSFTIGGGIPTHLAAHQSSVASSTLPILNMTEAVPVAVNAPIAPRQEEKRVDTNDIVYQHLYVTDTNKIILEYIGIGMCQDTYQYIPQLTFTENVARLFSVNDILAEQTSHLFLQGQSDQAFKNIAEYPDILSRKVAILDPHNVPFYGTILQIVALAGNFSAVDKMTAMMDLKTVHSELAEVFPSDWEAQTQLRMQPYVQALTDFAHDLKELKGSDDNALEKNAEPLVLRLKEALQNIPNTMVQNGLGFSSSIYLDACHIFNMIKAQIGGYNSVLGKVYWVRGFGLLQSRAMAYDLQNFRAGIASTASTGVTAIKSEGLNTNNKSIHYMLGATYFLGAYGLGTEGYHVCAIGNYDHNRLQPLLESYVAKVYQRCRLFSQLAPANAVVAIQEEEKEMKYSASVQPEFK